jgi:SAM-dependent methyltransferase
LRSAQEELVVEERDIREQIARYAFYHIIRLTDQISTPGNPRYVSTQNMVLEAMRGADFKGKRVLDVGCRDGLFSFEAEKLGSDLVVGIDNDLSKPAVEFLIPFFKSKVRMVEMNVLDLRPETFGKFDVVVFPGVLYHLRYPFWALRLLRDVLNPGGTLILETAVWRGQPDHALLYCPVEESPYESSSCSFFNEKGLRVTLQSLGFQVTSTRSRSEEEPAKNVLRILKHAWGQCMKRFKGERVLTDIDRAVLVCKYLPDSVDQGLSRYWDGIHDAWKP